MTQPKSTGEETEAPSGFYCHDFTKDPPPPVPISELLRNAIRLREAWKLYAISQREQIERLEEMIENLREYGSLFEESDKVGGETEIENGRAEIEILRHDLVAKGDPT